MFAASTNTARAADECILKPDSEPPQGQHWYYRTERESNRQCWYLGPQGGGIRKTSTETSKQIKLDGATPLSQQQRDALFRKFIEWQRSHSTQGAQ